MLDREPPIFGAMSDSYGSSRLAAGSAPSFGGLILGFVVGDRFGRRNAQYDNPDLREYYAGKCYDYWETQLKQTLSSTLQQDSVERKGQGQKLDEIFAKMSDLERAIAEFTGGKIAVPGQSQTQPGTGEGDKSSVAATKAEAARKL
jgi:hypothetical protein